jgi:site-specific recombinase XerD
MDGTPRLRISGPLVAYVDGFWQELLSRGYTYFSARNQLRVMSHLSRWLDGLGLEPSDMTSSRLDEFLVARRKAGYTCWVSRKGLRPLLEHLEDAGVVAEVPEQSYHTAQDTLLAEYGHYLLVDRGLMAGVVRWYQAVASRFLGCPRRLEVARIEARDVVSFILHEQRSLSRTEIAQSASALRCLLRFLHLRGELPHVLTGSVPSIAGWRGQSLPKHLPPKTVRKLSRGCDRRTHIGRRDFAVLLLLSRMGLRRGEVSALDLDDIDWENGELLVTGKGRRQARFPLPWEVGEAVASYVRRSRPRRASRAVFLGAKAPYCRLAPSAVTSIVYRACDAAGLPRVGAHRLRHTAATVMLRRGVPLQAVGEVLRHRHVDTTTIYAKVDRRSLRELARPWPEDAP